MPASTVYNTRPQFARLTVFDSGQQRTHQRTAIRVASPTRAQSTKATAVMAQSLEGSWSVWAMPKGAWSLLPGQNGCSSMQKMHVAVIRYST